MLQNSLVRFAHSAIFTLKIISIVTYLPISNGSLRHYHRTSKNEKVVRFAHSFILFDKMYQISKAKPKINIYGHPSKLELML